MSNNSNCSGSAKDQANKPTDSLPSGGESASDKVRQANG